MIAALALSLSACSASAQLHDGAPPTPAAPQVIVIERPAPAPAPIMDGWLVVFILVALVPFGALMMLAGVAHERRRMGRTVEYITAPEPQVIAQPERHIGVGTTYLLTDAELRAIVEAARAHQLEAPR
jgi:hypothetical protein